MDGALEQALRGATNLGRLNLFRNRARGGWEAAAARFGSETRFVVGIDDDSAVAVAKALQALARSTVSSATGAKTVEPIKPAERGYSGGIFG